MVTCDGAGASHDLVEHLDELAARRGYQLTYSVGWELGEREKAAIGWSRSRPGRSRSIGRGEVRERRADDACADAALRAPRPAGSRKRTSPS